LGLWHCGQLTSVGAEVFHCARRERVLLRDIFRLGTATSALLSIFYSVRNVKLAKRSPPGIGVRIVPVQRARLSELDSALGTQPRAVFPAQRRKRQRKHHRIAEGRFQVKPVAVKESFLVVGFVFTGVWQVSVQFLDADLHSGGQRVQAPRALARQRGNRRAGDEHPLGDCLESQIESNVRTGRDQD
jgi:hypothetical protein